MQLAKWAWEIFESSEVEEKRQLLNFVFQNLKLDGKNLLVALRELFHLFIQVKDSPGDGGGWTRTNGDRSRGIYSPLHHHKLQHAADHNNNTIKSLHEFVSCQRLSLSVICCGQVG
jgi:hypothetical protein